MVLLVSNLRLHQPNKDYLSEGLPECWFGGVGVKLFESMCVCMYVCMFVRMYVRLSILVGGST